MTDSWARARNAWEAAGIPPDRLAHLAPLGGGTYNTVEELRLTDGSRYVKWSPRSSKRRWTRSSEAGTGRQGTPRADTGGQSDHPVPDQPPA